MKGGLERSIVKGHKEAFESDGISIIWIVMSVSWMYTYVKLVKLYTLNMLSLLCVNYTSIKVVKTKTYTWHGGAGWNWPQRAWKLRP